MSREEKSQCLFSVLPRSLTPVSPFFFDIPTSDNRKDLLAYTRKKDTTNDPPLVASSDPSNSPAHIPLVPFDNDIHSANDDDLPIALRKAKRSYTNQPVSNFVSYKTLNPVYLTFVGSVSSVQVPFNLKEAIPQSQWRNAMCEEMTTLEKNETWELVDLPMGKQPVGCKWVYTVKYKEYGFINRYKVRLVSKGFTQTYGIDYHETFASVAKLNSI